MTRSELYKSLPQDVKREFALSSLPVGGEVTRAQTGKPPQPGKTPARLGRKRLFFEFCFDILPPDEALYSEDRSKPHLLLLLLSDECVFWRSIGLAANP
jgi:hypothetical protein